MELNKTAERSARIGAKMPVMRGLHSLGFRQIDLAVDGSFVSEGPSPFHELGFCTSGELLLLVGNGFERVETFSVKPQDVFFVPAGTTYSIHNDADVRSTLILACARDSLDETELRPARVGRTLLGDGSVDSHTPVLPSGNTYEVVFADNSDVSARERTVGDVFNRQVIAREFGVAESQLPEMSFGFFDPLVVRPLACDINANETQASGERRIEP